MRRTPVPRYRASDAVSPDETFVVLGAKHETPNAVVVSVDPPPLADDDDVSASEIPDAYAMEWRAMEPTDATDASESATAIHWKRWDAYDASGRAVLKDVYAQANFNAVPGFEVNLDAIARRAAAETRAGEDAPETVAAATAALLPILREAVSDDDLSEASTRSSPPARGVDQSSPRSSLWRGACNSSARARLAASSI